MTKKAIAAALLAFLTVSCSPASTDSPDPTFRVERHTWGGLCPEGPCRSDLIITAPGDWTLQTEAEERHGTISASQLRALRDSAVATNLPSTALETSDCAADADGQSLRYRWTVVGVSHEASSCAGSLDPTDPFAMQVEELSRQINRR